MARPLLRVARLPRLPIFERLCVEEALFYKTDSNWFVHSEGPPASAPCIVLGISGKPERLCDLILVARDSIPLVRRFSGGGTVIVDENTIFASLIMNRDDLPDVNPYPREIMDWSTSIYGPALQRIASAGTIQLGLRENDYVFGDMKFGGNAQAISRGRWLHHTSFLWSYQQEVMQYLQMPEKRPEYRGSRGHSSFLTPLSAHVAERGAFCPAVVHALHQQFDVHESTAEELKELIDSLGGAAAWRAACRTKYVGHDGKALDNNTPQHCNVSWFLV
jgi:lipoate-protein ligase A